MAAALALEAQPAAPEHLRALKDLLAARRALARDLARERTRTPANALLGRLEPAALVLYAGSIAWVIGYDTIYAHQDAEDDALVGIKSTALLFGERTHRALWIFYGIAVVLIGTALWLAGAGWFAFAGLAAFAAHLVRQIRRLDISSPALCLRIFKSNRDAGLLLFAGLLVDAVVRAVG